MLQVSGIILSIVNPTLEANNFELNPALITFMERDKFGGHPADNPNAHLHKFIAKCDTIKINRLSTEVI